MLPQLPVLLLSFGFSVAQEATIFDSRIVGGTEARAGQFPFFASISAIAEASMETYVPCGGSLISPTLVLTSAQCCRCNQVDSMFEIYLNAYHFNQTKAVVDSCTESFISTQRECHIDFDFSSQFPRNDFCLITLPRASVYTPAIVYNSNTIRLSSHPDAEKKTAVFTGVGDTNGAEDFPSTLQKVVLSVANAANCSSLWATKGRVVNSSDFICADASGPKSSCSGDVGGPLFTKMTNGNFLLLGVSFLGSTSCNDQNLPLLFSRVNTAAFKDWSQKLTKPKTTEPTRQPSLSRTMRPSKAPTLVPSRKPSKMPTIPGGKVPTGRPTKLPTETPTPRPTKSPVSKSPTKIPTTRPTRAPTFGAYCISKQFP